MILSIEESQSLCEWLQDRGFEMGECACVLGDLECGNSFALALLKVFNERKRKNNVVDWGNPIVP